MIKRLLISIMFSIFLVSCNHDRVEMIEVYNELSDKIESGALDSIPHFMDQESLDFYEQITDPTKLSIDQVIRIGIKYKVPYFSILYLANCGEHIKSSKKSTDFFRYLANNDISFFSKFNVYQVSEEKSKIGDEGFVAIYRTEGGVNKMTWAKFTRPDSNTFKYDLLYNLKLEEKRNREIYKEQRSAKKEIDDETFFRELFDSYNNQNCDL